MTAVKYEVEKFTNLNDFRIVIVEEVCSSIQQSLLEALE